MNDDMFSTEIPVNQQGFQFSKEQVSVIDEVLENVHSHYFITGAAGSGKSTILKELKRVMPRSVVVCPTGVAAVLVGGQTMHSMFSIPPRIVTVGDAKVTDNEHRKKMLNWIQNIIFDEISQCRADTLDYIDKFLRLNCNPDKPFGGKRVILFGDLDQISPVVTQTEAEILYKIYQSPYFFSAKCMTKFKLNVKYLHEVHRQKNDAGFLELLNAIKKNQISDEQLDRINTRVGNNVDNKLTITATNAVADFINKEQLGKLSTPLFTYASAQNGEFSATYTPAPMELRLKVGAKIVHLINDSEKDIYNGSRGDVTYLDDEIIKVKFEGKTDEIAIGKYTWENKKLKFRSEHEGILENVVGDFTQFPVKLGFATTVHKSQGQTYDAAHIDYGGSNSFAHGQTYVALSRCRTLEGVSLQFPLTRKDIIVDPAVASFYRQLEIKINNEKNTSI